MDSDSGFSEITLFFWRYTSTVGQADSGTQSGGFSGAESTIVEVPVCHGPACPAVNGGYTHPIEYTSQTWIHRHSGRNCFCHSNGLTLMSVSSL